MLPVKAPSRWGLIQFDHHRQRVPLTAERAEPEAFVERSGGVVALHAEREPSDLLAARFALERLEQRCADAAPAVGEEDGDRYLGGRIVDEAVAGRVRLEVPPPGCAQRF